MSWPTEGAIEFENVQLRYRPELPLVLKGVSFKVRPGEKVGIIGRTGAGKSSITQALFRMVEICGGGIWVDGRSIGELGLETVRTAAENDKRLNSSCARVLPSYRKMLFFSRAPCGEPVLLFVVTDLADYDAGTMSTRRVNGVTLN
jgi:ABC-type oligopeptide transport system ATPase subunit